MKLSSFIPKKKWIILILVLVGGYFGYRYFFGATTTRVAPVTEKDTVAVSTGTVRSVIQGVGTVTAASTQSLQFNSNGKIVKWNVKAGDIVKKGQILAEVDTRDVDNDIKGQELSLKNAQLSYDKLFTSTKEYQVVQMEKTIADTKQSIAIAPKELANLEAERDQKILAQKNSITQLESKIALQEKSIETLKSDMAYTEANSANTITQSSTDLTYTLSNASIAAGTELSDAATYVANLETSALNFKEDSTVPSEFSAEDSSKGTAAVNTFSALKTAIANYKTSLASANFTTTGGTLAFLSSQEILANAVITNTDAVARALDVSVSSSNFTQSTIDGLTNSVNSSRSKFTNYLTSVASTRKQIASNSDPSLVKQNADNTIANKKQSILSAQTDIDSNKRALAEAKVALDKLISDYEIKIQQKKNTMSTLGLSLKTSELNYLDLKDGPTSEEKASALNQITQAKISLEKAKKKKEDYQIIASFDGVVTASNGKVGEISTNSNSSSTTATSITVEVAGLYKIAVLVDQLDVVKIKAGQDVDISFDSYAKRTFTGTVSEVDPTPTTSQGVVSYTAKILFRAPSDLKLYNNMTAMVSIVTSSHENALLVPTAAISTDNEKQIVRLWKNNRAVPQEITTGGIVGDKTEVMSGVTLGDKVVNKTVTISTASGASGGFSLFGAGGGNRNSSTRTSTPSSTRSGDTGAGGPPPGM